MTSIAASPPWLLAYGGNDDGLQTGPLKEVQLEGRYAPSSGFILHDGLSCQVNVDRYSNRHFSHTSTVDQHCQPLKMNGKKKQFQSFGGWAIFRVVCLEVTPMSGISIYHSISEFSDPQNFFSKMVSYKKCIISRGFGEILNF